MSKNASLILFPDYFQSHFHIKMTSDDSFRVMTRHTLRSLPPHFESTRPSRVQLSQISRKRKNSAKISPLEGDEDVMFKEGTQFITFIRIYFNCINIQELIHSEQKANQNYIQVQKGKVQLIDYGGLICFLLKRVFQKIKVLAQGREDFK